MAGTVVIKRVFNNNVAMVTSDDGSELIVIGRGLCFGRHAGDAAHRAAQSRIDQRRIGAVEAHHPERPVDAADGVLEHLARHKDGYVAMRVAHA